MLTLAEEGDLEEVSTSMPLTLSELRPALAAMALGPFMDHGKHPELVFRFVFELWHAYVRRLHRDETWPDTLFFVDIEDPFPTISYSKATTASFACIEELGVTPPPVSGWQDKAPAEGEDKSEWQVNVENRDWIYHTTDDMYFHLPSNSLWERREMECCDPKAEAHTYYRVDAVHLQALSMFASTLDSALVPMAWKAWVRYMRKKKDRHFGLSKPPASPHKSNRGQKKDITSPKDRNSLRQASSRGSRSPQERASRVVSRGVLEKAVEASKAAEPAIEPPAKAPVAVSPPPEPPPEPPVAEPPPQVEAEANINGTSGQGVVENPDNTKPVLAVELLEGEKPANEKAPMTLPPEDDVGDKVAKGGLLCFRCFGSRRSRQRPEAPGKPPETAAPLRASTAPPEGSAAAEIKPGRPSAQGAVEWVKFNEGKDAAEVKEVPRPCIDTVERHMRRLDQFLEIVRRNPQKLVDHVERRRAEKTTLAFAML